jgi:hypothetical protein
VNPLYTLEDYDVSEVKKASIVWELGVSGKSCSVSEEGILRAIEFTIDLAKPSVSHVLSTVKKAMLEPRDPQSVIHKPEFVVFLETVILSESERKKVTDSLAKLDVTVTTLDELKRDRPELFDIKKALPFVNRPLESKEVIPFNEQPPRGCFSCRKDIPGKASQCSACKAVIYCSAECAKRDWPNHKQNCQMFRKTVEHIKEWKLHDFPFSYYNSNKILCNYNAVPFLSSVGRHNAGVFQRMCGCFQEMPWGALGAHMLASFQQNQSSPELMFQALGLPEGNFC